jgi:hypothetical protein
MNNAIGTFEFKGETLTALKLAYRDGSNNTAIELVDAEGFPYARLSVNLEGNVLPDGHFAVKAYSENVAIAEAARASGLFEPTGTFAYSPYVTAEVWKIKAA